MQAFDLAPRLIVSITIDQLNNNSIDTFLPFFSNSGLKKLMQEGKMYETGTCPSVPVSRPASIATIATGTTPFYHGIIGNQWIDHASLRPSYCLDDKQYIYGPSKLKTSTISDEMKVSSHGKSIIYSVAASKDAAILSAGHAADNALWYDDTLKKWRTTAFYGASPQWLNIPTAPRTIDNDGIVDKAISIVSKSNMGKDDIADMLNVTLSVSKKDNIQLYNRDDWQKQIYIQLDKALAKLIGSIEQQVGKNHVLFVITGTGTSDDTENDYSLYRVPTGNFYINRTSKLLNVYLSAVYGQGTYIDATCNNQIYLNHKIIEQKQLNMHEVLSRCQELLLESEGVSDVYTSERLLSGNLGVQEILKGYNPSVSGDIIINVSPGWKLINEDTQENYTSRNNLILFPIIFYGMDIKPERIFTPTTIDRIAPTICKSINIRAPNACSTAPLF